MTPVCRYRLVSRVEKTTIDGSRERKGMTIPVSVQQRIRLLDQQGTPWRAIARDLNVSRDTVRKYALMEDCSPKPKPSTTRPRKLDGFTPVIDRRAGEGRQAVQRAPDRSRVRKLGARGQRHLCGRRSGIHAAGPGRGTRPRRGGQSRVSRSQRRHSHLQPVPGYSHGRRCTWHAPDFRANGSTRTAWISPHRP